MDKQKRIAFFHEDDYCQREILPLTAKNFCLKQMGEINDFSQEHQLESGLFTDIFIRENTPHGIEELGLCSEQLNAALNFLPLYDLVETGYSSYREESEATCGRGNGYEQNIFLVGKRIRSSECYLAGYRDCANHYGYVEKSPNFIRENRSRFVG